MDGLAEEEIRRAAAEELRDRLRSVIQRRKIKQRTLAGLADVAASSVTNTVRSDRPLPGLDILLAIGRVLEVDQDWIEEQANIANGTTPLAEAVSRTWVVGVLPPVARGFLMREQVGIMAAYLEAGKSVVLAGMGGVGKSQIAGWYARSVGDEQQDGEDQLDLVVWVDAATRSSVVSTYAQAYEEVVASRVRAHHASAGRTGDPAEQQKAAEKFVNWMSTTDRSWLVVLDGAPSLGEVSGLLPDVAPSRRLVVTTRSRSAAWHTDSRVLIEVDQFTPEQALAYLRGALGHPKRRLSDADMDLAELASTLGHLPVGLSHAAAYLIDADLDVSTYLEDLRNRALRLVDVMPASEELPDEQRLPLAALWDISLEHADRARPQGLARPVLQLAALLDGQAGIPESLFTDDSVIHHLTEVNRCESGEDSGGNDAAGKVRERDVRVALRTLDRLHLTDHEQGLIRMHPLLQWAVREHPTIQLWSDAAVVAAGDALTRAWTEIPEGQVDEVLVRRLQSSARELQANDTNLALWNGEAHPVMFLYEMHLVERGAATTALEHFTDLLKQAEDRFGPRHLAVLMARLFVAECRGYAGAPEAAVHDLEGLLSDIRQDDSVDGQVVGSVLYSLGNWQGAAGQPTDAVATLTEALNYIDGEKEILTVEHNLAVFRCESGDMQEGDRRFRELVKRKTRLLGADHPETLASRHERARWRGLSDDTEYAAKEMARVLRDRQRVLGLTHPETLKTQHEAANWRIANGDREGGIADLELVIDLRTENLGSDAADTLLSRLMLASVRSEVWTQESVDALALVVRDIDRALSPNHPTRKRAHQNLKTAREVLRQTQRFGSITIGPAASGRLQSMWQASDSGSRTRYEPPPSN